jgi:hypothetical protein
MNPADKRRVLACWAALVAVPFYCNCAIRHFCICGHLAHPPHPWIENANDLLWISCFAIAMVFACRSNLPSRIGFIALIAVPAFLPHFTPFTLPFAIYAIPVSIQGLRFKGDSDDLADHANECPPSDEKPSASDLDH